MSLLHLPYHQQCEILDTAINAYGDEIEVDREAWPCHFREITTILESTNREDVAAGDALLWVDPQAPIQEGSIVYVDTRYWRVTQLTKARRFGDEVQFFKCKLEKHNEPATEDLS